MNRNLLVLTLCLFASSGYSMTASVSSTTQPATPPLTPDAAKSSSTPTDGTNRTSTTNPSPGKSAAPSAATVTRPAAVLSAPGVPPKANATQSAKKRGAVPSKSNTFMPSATSQSGAVAPAPGGTAWAATAGRQNATMRRGTLQAINVGPGTFQVYGQKLTFNPQRVKVFNRDGRPGSIYALKTGASIRFTLDATDPKQRRVAVIYVD
jgi:hypothetical protein